MNRPPDSPEAEVTPDQIVHAAYEASKTAYEPISRRRLALLLVSRTGMPYKDAFAVVDTYCEQQALPVPTYLGKEFSIYWLKALAVSCVPIAIGFIWYARNRHLEHEYPWIAWVVGAVFGGLAVFLWVRSLESEAAQSKAPSQESPKAR